MTTTHKLDDSGFEADNLDDLKKQIEDFYSRYGRKPEVEIRDGKVVVVTNDSGLAKKVETLVEKAARKCNRQRFGEAMDILDEAQKLAPCNGDIHRLKAQVHFHGRDYDRAIDACMDALRFNPRDHHALTLMGNILMQGKGDGAAARSYYEKSLECRPGNHLAASNLGALEMREGNYERAHGIYKGLVDKGAAYATTHYGYALCCSRMGRLREAFDIGVDGLKGTEDSPENPGVKDELLRLTYKVACELMEGVNVMDVLDGLREKLEKGLSMPLEVRRDDGMAVYGRMEYGPTHGRDHHVLYYRGNAPANALHTLLHEMTHLEMNSEASKLGKNRIMYSDEGNYRKFRESCPSLIKKLGERLGDGAEEQIRKLFRMFCLLVMNTPLDLFVERRIHDRYGTLRPFQFTGLYRQAFEYLRSVTDPDIKELFPGRMVEQVRLCNLLTAMHVKDLYGIDTVGLYAPTKGELARAKDLHDEFQCYRGHAPGEEYEYLDYFIGSLGVEGYFIVRDESDFMQERGTADGIPGMRVEAQVGREEADRKNDEFLRNHPDDASSQETMMMSMYMLGALQGLDRMPMDKVRGIALEIAMIGVKGIDPGKSGYRVPSLGRTLGGYELLAYYYVSWEIAFPGKMETLRLPFSEAYRIARKMFRGGKNHA